MDAHWTGQLTVGTPRRRAGKEPRVARSGVTQAASNTSRRCHPHPSLPLASPLLKAAAGTTLARGQGRWRWGPPFSHIAQILAGMGSHFADGARRRCRPMADGSGCLVGRWRVGHALVTGFPLSPGAATPWRRWRPPSASATDLRHGGWCLTPRHPVSGGEGGSGETLSTMAMQSSWWGWRHSAWTSDRDRIVLGAAILMVGVAARRVRGGTNLHGGGWRRRAASVWRLLDALVLAVVGGWSWRSWAAWLPPGEMLCYTFVLRRWVGVSESFAPAEVSNVDTLGAAD
jgi:hypothetical protein